MRIDFQPAFAVDIRHDYYPDGISADFSIAPTPHCQLLLQKQGLLFKETQTGFVVLYETSAADGSVEPKRKLAAPLSLSFVLCSKSPFLFNYSELPLDKSAEQFFVLSNRQKSINNGQRLLTADHTVEYLSVADLLDLRPQHFQVEFATSAGSLVWELFDIQETLLQRQRVTTVEGVSRYLVDLGQRPAGQYLLRRNGVEQLRFYADEQLVGGFPFGLIEIAVDPLVTDDFSFVDGSGNIQFRHYQLKLQARRTTWEYLVVAKYETGLNPSDLRVTLDDPPVSFNRQSAVTLADGSTAIPFVANAVLPLRKQPLKGIALRKKKGPSTPKLDIANLPNPSVADIIPAAGSKVISRVYVYV